jgi:TolB-like protein
MPVSPNGSFLFRWVLIIPALLSCTINSTSSSSLMTEPSLGGVSPQTTFAPLPEPLVLSVLSFEDRTRLPEFAWLRKGLADMLITDLSQAPGLEVVQRERLEDVMREQSLQATGRVRDKSAVRIGRLTGATVILLGSASRVGDVLRLDAHLLDVERGTVLGAASVNGGMDDVLALEKQLVARLLGFLQRDGPRMTPSGPPVRSPDAKKFTRDVEGADRDDIDEAAAEFEAALRNGPPYADAERRYELALRKIDTARLSAEADAESAEDRRRLGARLAHDLFRGGWLAEVSTRGAGKDSLLHVVVRLDDVMLLRFRREIERTGGTVAEEGGRLIFRLQPEVQAEFVRALEERRRVFLHFQTSDGRQIAIYSRLKDWEGRHWISVAKDADVVLDLGQQIEETLPLNILPSEMLPLKHWVTLDPVPHEKAVLQVELLRMGDDGREVLISPRPEGQMRAAIPSQLPESETEELRADLLREFERLWNPAIWERIPGPGYLPSARRTIVVSAQIQARKLTGPRIVGSSGDRAYEKACLSLVSADGSRLEPLLGRLERLEGTVRVRVTCDLLKDVPSLWMP